MVLGGFLAFALTSCDDFLTETPSTSVAETEAFASASDFTNNLHGLYSEFGSYNFTGRDVLFIGDACADVAQHTNETNNLRQLPHWIVYDSDDYLEVIWEYGYKVIAGCSEIIANASMAEEMPESSQATVYLAVAEAYGLRALALFYLTNLWGLPYNSTNAETLGVVNVDEPISVGQTVTRNTVGENYEQMLSDIENAKKYYSLDGVEDPGVYYLNEAAVYALDARVKLFMQNYSGAISAAETALSLFDGSMMTTADAFQSAWSTNVASSEDIFTQKKSASDNCGSESLHTMYGLYGGEINEEWLELFADDDIRTEVLNLSYGKFIGTSDGVDINNVPIFRLPELYLTIAEAKAEQGNYSEAKQYLMEVTEARNSMDSDDIPITSDIIDVIHIERSKEFTQEGFRLFDVRRWGEKISVAGGTYTDFDVAKFVYPIPAAEVNSGYGVTQTENWSSYLPK